MEGGARAESSSRIVMCKIAEVLASTPKDKTLETSEGSMEEISSSMEETVPVSMEDNVEIMPLIPVTPFTKPAIKNVEPQSIFPLALESDCVLPAGRTCNVLLDNILVSKEYYGRIQNVVWAVANERGESLIPVSADGPIYFSDHRGRKSFRLRNELKDAILIPKDIIIAYFVLKPIGITENPTNFEGDTYMLNMDYHFGNCLWRVCNGNSGENVFATVYRQSNISALIPNAVKTPGLPSVGDRH